MFIPSHSFSLAKHCLHVSWFFSPNLLALVLVFYYWDRILLCSPRWPQTPRNPPASSAGITSMWRHTQHPLHSTALSLGLILVPSTELQPQKICFQTKTFWTSGHGLALWFSALKFYRSLRTCVGLHAQLFLFISVNHFWINVRLSNWNTLQRPTH